MIRYSYNRQVTPPAPFVHVTLRRPDGTGDLSDWPAQLDTGADRSVIPRRVADELGLTQLREVSVARLGGDGMPMPTFLIQATIRQMRPLTVEMLASPGEPYVLLGRDVLNHYRIVLDGPQLAFELD